MELRKRGTRGVGTADLPGPGHDRSEGLPRRSRRRGPVRPCRTTLILPDGRLAPQDGPAPFQAASTASVVVTVAIRGKVLSSTASAYSSGSPATVSLGT